MQEINAACRPSANKDGYLIEELTNAQFTTYANISTLTGVTQGVAINEGAGWLRFIMDGKELIVSKMNIKHSLSRINLNAAGALTGKPVVINGKNYLARTLTGSNGTPRLTAEGYFLPGTRDSEWDKLFYPIVSDDSRMPIPPRNVSARYTQAQLETGNRASICPDVVKIGSNDFLVRGTGCSRALGITQTLIDTSVGWRPCLELVN